MYLLTDATNVMLSTANVTVAVVYLLSLRLPFIMDGCDIFYNAVIDRSKATTNLVRRRQYSSFCYTSMGRPYHLFNGSDRE